MKIAGIVAEYNPFHNGHKFQIEQTKKAGATHIVVIMSGNFVQRGDIAVCRKHKRAQACLLNGADLVIELPVIYSLSTANIFAYASVFILNQLNINMLSFGSEVGDISLLANLAIEIENIEQSTVIKEFLDMGLSFPVARQKAIEKVVGAKVSKVALMPNNVLGIEYIRAINKINKNIIPFTLEREQAQHDCNITGETIASASKLREIIVSGNLQKVKKYMPESAFEILSKEIQNGLAPIKQIDIQQAMLYKLRTMDKSDFLNLPDVSEGLENRLYEAAQKATTIDEFFSLVKTKRYILSRVRRIAYCALFDIKKQHTKTIPQYIRVLASNNKGFEIIKHAKKTATIPIETSFSKLYNKLDKHSGIYHDKMATDIYNLAFSKIQPCNTDFTNNPIIVKSE